MLRLLRHRSNAWQVKRTLRDLPECQKTQMIDLHHSAGAQTTPSRRLASPRPHARRTEGHVTWAGRRRSGQARLPGLEPLLSLTNLDGDSSESTTSHMYTIQHLTSLSSSGSAHLQFPTAGANSPRRRRAPPTSCCRDGMTPTSTEKALLPAYMLCSHGMGTMRKLPQKRVVPIALTSWSQFRL